MIKIKLIVENNAKVPFEAEHGLALLVDCGVDVLLFDTGAGNALRANASLMGVDLVSIKNVVLSHGHNDHTGGLHEISNFATIHATSSIDVRRFSIHEGLPVRDISMPVKSVEKLHCSNWNKVDGFKEIFSGAFLTGAIPRNSGEDTGGPFFLDARGEHEDIIFDEQALLLSSGVLIQGCCHSGIINTMQYCKQCCPQIRINTIIGGLHLLNATHERLAQTASYLNESGVKKLFPLHCTGQNAIEFFMKECPDLEIANFDVGQEIVL